MNKEINLYLQLPNEPLMELVRGFTAKFIDISKPADGAKEDISVQQLDPVENEFPQNDDLQAQAPGRKSTLGKAGQSSLCTNVIRTRTP